MSRATCAGPHHQASSRSPRSTEGQQQPSHAPGLIFSDDFHLIGTGDSSAHRCMRHFCLLRFQDRSRGRGSEEGKSFPEKAKGSDLVTTNEGHWEEKLKASLLQECSAALGC